PARALGPRDAHREEPDVAEADHDRAVRPLDAREIPSVDTDRHRLDQRGDVGRERRRAPMRLIGGHADVLGEAAVGPRAREAAAPELDAKVLAPAAAVDAGAARERRLDDDLIAL